MLHVFNTNYTKNLFIKKYILFAQGITEELLSLPNSTKEENAIQCPPEDLFVATSTQKNTYEGTEFISWVKSNGMISDSRTQEVSIELQSAKSKVHKQESLTSNVTIPSEFGGINLPALSVDRSTG